MQQRRARPADRRGRRAAVLAALVALLLGGDRAALRALGDGAVASAQLAAAQPAEAVPAEAAPAAPSRAPARRRAPAGKGKPRGKGKPPVSAPELGAEPVDPYASPTSGLDVATVTVPPRVGIADLPAMQGLLAVQRLDAWLLHDDQGQDPVALRLLAPIYRPQHAWFYVLPVTGEPTLLSHAADAAAFEKVTGQKLTYSGYREQLSALRELLKGKKQVAMELDVQPERPGAAKLPADTRELLRGLKVSVVSSDNLVQYTTAVWGSAGHTAHHVAVHHLVELRKDALAHLAKQLKAGAAITEYQLQQRLVSGMAMRGVVGPPPSVAAGVNTATPGYQPSAVRSAVIQEGDLVLIGLALRVDQPDGIFAAQTWVAYAGAAVPERVSKLFDSVTLARDQAIALISDRNAKRKPLRGYEVDRLARGVLSKAGLAAQVLHRSGHSIDTSLEGAGANLDDYDRKDTRSLVAGTGVTLGPAVYFAGELGVRSEVTVFVSPSGPEVTTPAQHEVEALLAP
ncbi:MAG: M24 family metallopeptidase [Kofleriaceae bacterium]